MWRDRRVIVTGGTAGFGFVLARHLAAAGARVLVVGRSGEGVRMALAALEATGPAVRGVAADLTQAGEGGHEQRITGLRIKKQAQQGGQGPGDGVHSGPATVRGPAPPAS